MKTKKLNLLIDDMGLTIYGRKKMSCAKSLCERGAGARATDRRYSAARSVSDVGFCPRGRSRYVAAPGDGRTPVAGFKAKLNQIKVNQGKSRLFLSGNVTFPPRLRVATVGGQPVALTSDGDSDLMAGNSL